MSWRVYLKSIFITVFIVNWQIVLDNGNDRPFVNHRVVFHPWCALRSEKPVSIWKLSRLSDLCPLVGSGSGSLYSSKCRWPGFQGLKSLNVYFWSPSPCPLLPFPVLCFGGFGNVLSRMNLVRYSKRIEVFYTIENLFSYKGGFLPPLEYRVNYIIYSPVLSGVPGGKSRWCIRHKPYWAKKKYW